MDHYGLTHWILASVSRVLGEFSWIPLTSLINGTWARFFWGRHIYLSSDLYDLEVVSLANPCRSTLVV